MELAFQMARGMFVPRKLRPEVYLRPAALTIEAQHCQLICAGVYVGPNREIPAAANARDLDVIPARFTQGGKIGGLNVVPGIWIVQGSAQLSLKHNPVIAGALDQKLPWVGSSLADQGDFWRRRQISDLVH